MYGFHYDKSVVFLAGAARFHTLMSAVYILAAGDSLQRGYLLVTPAQRAGR